MLNIVKDWKLFNPCWDIAKDFIKFLTHVRVMVMSMAQLDVIKSWKGQQLFCAELAQWFYFKVICILKFLKIYKVVDDLL